MGTARAAYRLSSLLCVAVVLAGVALSATPAAASPDQLEQVLEQARRATRLVEGEAQVRQIYRVRWLGVTWEFDAWVSKREDSIVVQTVGAPWFIPEELSLALVEAFDLLEGYEPTLEGRERTPAGQEVWVVRAVPRQPGHGARLVRFWVEPADGTVTHLELSYWWGHLVIDQTYQQVGPYTVLDTQQIEIRPLGITAEVRYRDYRMGPGPTVSAPLSPRDGAAAPDPARRVA
ncbi:MAG TPA: hypothetical protein VIK73_07200 [Limnochordales bacterium]